MGFPTVALSGGNLTSVRSAKWYGAGYCSLVPNNVVWSTTLSATSTGTTNAIVSFGSTISGSSASVVVGQRVLIGTVNDVRQASFSGRVRIIPGISSMGINETSKPLTSGMYMWVIDDYPLLDKLARPVGDPPVQYKDYDFAFEKIKPVIVGVQTAYAGFVNSSARLRLTLDASGSYGATSGATISTYLWSFAAATYTVISGGLGAAAVTVDLIAGFQWGQLIVTDSNGISQTRHFAIWAHDASNVPALSFQGASITGDLSNGWVATVETYADVSSMLDNTMAILWSQEYYNDTEGPINTNIDMVGWTRREDDPAQTDPNYSLVTLSRFEIAGIGAIISNMEMQLLALSYVTSATVWDQIVNLTPWRAIVHVLQRHTTLLELADLTFDSVDDTFMFQYITTQGGNVLAAMNGIANQINAAMEFAPDGQCRIVRDARYLSSSARSALLTYAGWTAQDYTDLTLSYTHLQQLGKVDADGAYFTHSANLVTPLRSRAPGLAQNIGQNTYNLNNQILGETGSLVAAQAELNVRAGNAYEISGTPTYSLNGQHPDGYHFLIPSVAILYTWTLTAGTDNIRGISYDTSTAWLLENVNITINNDTGTRTVNFTYRQMSPVGNSGTTIQIPSPGSLPVLPSIPPFDPFASFPDDPSFTFGSGVSTANMPPYVNTGMTGVPGHVIVAPKDGNTVLVWSSSKVWTSRSFAARSVPVWTEVTPTGISTITACCFTGFGQGAYILAYDGTYSSIWYTPDVFASPPTWTQGANVAGLFTIIRASSTDGSVAIYSPATIAGGGWSIVLDWSATNYSSTYSTSTSGQGGATPGWSAGVGYGGVGIYLVSVTVSLTGDASTFVTNVGVTLSLVNPSGSGVFTTYAGNQHQDTNPGVAGTYAYDVAYADGPFNVTFPLPFFRGNFNGPNYPGNNYDVRLLAMRMSGVGTLPTVS